MKTREYLHRITLALLVVATTGLANAAMPTSYTRSVAANAKSLFAYYWQNKGLSLEFPSNTVFDGTVLQFWDIGTQAWVSTTWRASQGIWSGAGSTHTFTNGEAFFVQNPSASSSMSVTVWGSVVTNSSVSFSLSKTNYYCMSYAYPMYGTSYTYQVDLGGAFLEYIDPTYTDYNLGYPANIGDLWYYWDDLGQEWAPVPNTQYNYTGELRIDPNGGQLYWTKEGSLVSPTITYGHGFLLLPHADTTWTHYPYGYYQTSAYNP